MAYTPPVVMTNSAGEGSRKIRSEDFDWDTTLTPPPLTFCAALVLSRIFTTINPLQRILQKDIDILMDLYPADIPLKYSVTFIKVHIVQLFQLFQHLFP